MGHGSFIPGGSPRRQLPLNELLLARPKNHLRESRLSNTTDTLRLPLGICARGRLVEMTISILEIRGIAVGILVLVRGSVDERCEILRWATGVIGSSLQASRLTVSWNSSFSPGRGLGL